MIFTAIRRTCNLSFERLKYAHFGQTLGQFLENCTQLLHPEPNFFTVFSGEEVEYQKKFLAVPRLCMYIECTYIKFYKD